MTPARHKNLLIILILGALSTISPFAIDMYLPTLSQIAGDLGTTLTGFVIFLIGRKYVGRKRHMVD